jgi:hypothetical protein
MHRKFLATVALVALVILAQSPAFAKGVPGGSLIDEVLLPRLARGIEKDVPASTDPLPGSTTEFQAGIPRSGATFCSGDGYGGALGQYSDWFYGDEFYAAYQDPEEFGTCDGQLGLYTFNVTEVDWWVVDNTDTEVFEFQPLVFENAGGIICPFPGNVLCAGPLYATDFPGTGGYLLRLPFVDECCVYESYFAGVYAASFHGPGHLGIVVDDDGTDDCWVYNDYGGGWVDLSGPLPAGNPVLYSEGLAFDQNLCPGTPGMCLWLAHHGSAAYAYTEPDVLYGLGLRYYWSRFHADLPCTLMAARFSPYDGYTQGTPTVRAHVWGGNGPVSGGRMYPDAFGVPPETPGPNYLGFVDIPYADLSFNPDYTEVDLTSLGPLVFGVDQNYFIGFSLSPNTPDPATDQICFLSDDGTFTSNRSGMWVAAVSNWLYTDEVFSSGANFLFDAYTCSEEPPPPPPNCDNPGPDDWNTWAHDYERTCWSSMDVGDPCQLTPVWSQDLQQLNSFCGPTVADGRVYVSDDATLYSFDLLTGAPGNTIAGLPHIFNNNRGNVTIDGGMVYVTGGNAQSIGQWNADLSVNHWVNGLNYPPDPPDGSPLGGQCRFGVTAVYEIAGTEVVVVGTENPGGSSPGGRLWCLETATGDVYSGWPTNPVILPEGVWHSPAYDGDDLYVGTASSDLTDGMIYRIDAATGAVIWSYTSTNFPHDSYPGGVSLDDDFVYAASSFEDQSGSRVKLNKSDGSVVWEFPEARALYGVPVVGRDFVFINQDGNGIGVLAVEKNVGAALYNFAANGVGSVPQHVTLSCDKYVFAGDRLGNWWLLDIDNQDAVWRVPFNGIVNQTVLASHDGQDFAVVSVRSGNSTTSGGYVAAFKLNAGARPIVLQNVTDVDIHVEPGTGPGNPYTATKAIANAGCADLHITGHNIDDPAPDVAAKAFRDARSRYAAAAANAVVGRDYVAYFEAPTKSAAIRNRILEFTDAELTRGDIAMEQAAKSMVDSKRSRDRMTAASSILRTSNVTYTTPLGPGQQSAMNWLYDGTAIERGIDVEQIELITDDPNRVFFGNQPVITIRYIGGCLPDFTSIVWNTFGAANEERVYNTGRLGDDNTNNDLLWGADPNGADADMMYDGTFLVAGPHPPNGDTAQFYLGNIYELFDEALFVPNPATGTSECRFDGESGIHLGWKRTGGCPGTPEEITGAWVRSYFSDTNKAFGGSFGEAIGLDISMTEVGANDPLYGDFALLKWDLTERYGETESPVYAGTWADWDVPPDFDMNHGIISDNFNGYALWDHATPNLAYGFLDPRLLTDYCGINTVPYSPHRIQEMGQTGGYDLWQLGSSDELALLWDDVVNGAPRENGPHEGEHCPNCEWEDHFGLLVNKALNIGPHETASIIQAKFAVDASSGDPATVDALATELATRAAIWSGYARGNVNMDDCVDLVDVCWLMNFLFGGTAHIYPDTYNGDVNLSGITDVADANYLLQYVTGLGPAPQGAWRFTF